MQRSYVKCVQYQFLQMKEHTNYIGGNKTEMEWFLSN
jgi:hypothetical protein